MYICVYVCLCVVCVCMYRVWVVCRLCVCVSVFRDWLVLVLGHCVCVRARMCACTRVLCALLRAAMSDFYVGKTGFSFRVEGLGVCNLTHARGAQAALEAKIKEVVMASFQAKQVRPSTSNLTPQT